MFPCQVRGRNTKPVKPRSRIIRVTLALHLILCAFPFLAGGVAAQGITADHVAVGEFPSIPAEVVDSIQARCDFFYGHTSHGSQVMTGLDMVYAEDASFAEPTFHEYGDDLGGTGDTSWVAPTRSWLDAHPECNVVMWSWCGGCSGNTEAGIDIYLNAMADLESDYPGVTFIYMTGHLDGTGPSGNLYARNNQIRAYCASNGKILFDFADIESWDPDGTWYPDESDACAWCADWCAVHTCPTCGSCAHSHCFNCYRKGKAFWWMMARVVGWQPATSAPGADEVPAPVRLRLSTNAPNPFNPATTIGFELPGAADVSLEIYSAAGRRIATLVRGERSGGAHTASWDGNDDAGKPAPSGVYFCRLASGGRALTRPMVLIR